MAKVALVLSGGGAKGAFQAAAERYAREVKGYRWDIIAGVSVGALNGGMLAMLKYSELWDLWATISNRKVFTGRMDDWYAVWRILTGHKSILGNGPLKKIIEREFDPELVRVDLRIGAVSLLTGNYSSFGSTDPHFKDAVLASTAMPAVWAPVDVPPHGPMVDGGVRNVSPLGDVLDDNPDEVVIINCSPRKPEVVEQAPGKLISIARRSLDIAVNEIFVGDVREFTRINRNVKEAAEQNVTLHNEDGKAYKFFEHKLIEPSRHLGDSVDFSPATAHESMKAGWLAAEAVLGAPGEAPVPFPDLPPL